MALLDLAADCGSTGDGQAPPTGCVPGSCDDPVGYETEAACPDGESCLCDRCPSYCDALCPLSLPNADVMANAGDDQDEDPPLVEADFSCLGKDEPPPAPKQDVTMTGIVMDFEDEYPIEAATVEAFATALALDVPVASTTSGKGGSYTLVLPVAQLDSARVSWRVQAEDQLETLHLNQAIACQSAPCTMTEDRLSVSQVTSDSLTGILGTSRPDGTSIVIGDVLDCRRRSVANANGRLFSSNGDPVAGTEVYYFETEFPVRRWLQPWSSPDGLVGILDVEAAGVVEIRAFGRIDGKETLLSAVAVPPVADAVVITDMDVLGPR